MKNSFDKKRKSRQRLGSSGGGLSLPAFVNAKSKPRLNPSDVRKKREQYQNAKKIKKYRNLSKHLPHQEQKLRTQDPIAGIDTESKATDDVSALNGRVSQGSSSDFGKKKEKFLGKRRNVLEGLRQEFMKKKEEEDRLKAERLEALKVKEEARKNAMQSRKDLKAKMFKKTSSGQPLMKHRLQHILESIQQRQ